LLAIGVITGLIFTFSVGFGDFFQSLIARKIGRYRTLFYRHLVTFFMILPLLIYFIIKGRAIISLENALWIVLGTVFYLYGYINFLKAFEIGNVSIVSPVSSACSIVTVILSAIFLKEILSLTSYLAILIILLGIVLTSTDIKRIKEIKRVAGLKESFITMVMFGIYFFALGAAGKKMSALSLFLWAMVIQSLIFFIFNYARSRKAPPVSDKSNLFILFALIVILYILAWVGFNYGAAKGMISIVAPVSSLYPVITVILACIFYQEKLVFNQKAGIGTVILGLLLLNL
jgi:drug/metabolite transporter (DMT)-like permease